MDANLQVMLSILFLYMKIVTMWYGFHWILSPEVPLNNKPALVHKMAWHRTGEPLSEPTIVLFTDA